MAPNFARSTIALIADPGRFHREHLLIADRAVILDAKLDEHGGPFFPLKNRSRAVERGNSAQNADKTGFLPILQDGDVGYHKSEFPAMRFSESTHGP
ncbi:hypothetical protein [Aquisphaera insulae]|uniref:hypothetical protein n=1 Tax=Aquisphaera insulae TaxID=2712864 RepID=UPI0013ED4DB1|nr:hypothetical protein [Aquisphaera insulae]